jgi:hypothetical protein
MCTLAVLVGVALAVSVPASSGAAGPPDAKNAEAAVQAAATQLVKEADGGKLREASNYFTKNIERLDEVTPEAILAALERKHSQDLRVDSYVKWQLLSGMPGKIDQKLVPRLMSLYQAAVAIQLPTNPTMNQQVWPELDAEARKKSGQTGAEELTEWLDKRFAQAMGTAEAMTNLRSQLFAAIPMSPSLCQLALKDAMARNMAGWESREFQGLLLNNVRHWALMGAPQGEVQAVAGQLDQIQKNAANKANAETFPVVYGRARFDNKDKKVVWEKRRTGFDAGPYAELLKFLAERGSNKGLKFN